MKWLRLYHDLPHDPKLRRIAYQAGATLPQTIAVWVCMLCHASENEGEARGTLRGWDDDDCAFALGMDRAVVFAIHKQMEGRTLDGDSLIAWQKRQYPSDNEAQRKRTWRAKKAQENQSPKNEGTGQSQDSPNHVPNKRRGEEIRSREVNLPTRARAHEMVLPAWLPPSAWAEWCAYRKGKTWTQRAAELSVKALGELRDAGHDPTRVIEQSIAHGWRGLFPLKAAAKQGGKLDWIFTDPIFGDHDDAASSRDCGGLGSLPAPDPRQRQ